jgi:hypothetical protein
MGLVSMFCSDLGQSFDTTFPFFSGYTISFLGHVSGEQWGGAVKIMSRIGVEHGN